MFKIIFFKKKKKSDIIKEKTRPNIEGREVFNFLNPNNKSPTNSARDNFIKPITFSLKKKSSEEIDHLSALEVTPRECFDGLEARLHTHQPRDHSREESIGGSNSGI